jgi:hypothetical protein
MEIYLSINHFKQEIEKILSERLSMHSADDLGVITQEILDVFFENENLAEEEK